MNALTCLAIESLTSCPPSIQATRQPRVTSCLELEHSSQLAPGQSAFAGLHPLHEGAGP